MSISNNSSLTTSVVVIVSLIAITSVWSAEAATCRQISNKFAKTSPWTTYPVLFEPIKKGRLTVWTGISSLPMSEFRCIPDHNNTSVVVLNFSSFANKLEWTFQDIKNEALHHGISVIHYENIRFKVVIKNNQADTYLECNTIQDIEILSSNETTKSLGSTCHDCSSSLIALIDGQIQEISDSKLIDNTKDNLRWHLTQILTNQHVTNPIPF